MRKKRRQPWKRRPALSWREVPGPAEGRRAAWVTSTRIIDEIQRWIELHDQRAVRLSYTPIDRMRLLRLEVWSRVHRITVGEILELVVRVLRGQTRQARHKKHMHNAGLGISVATLTGDAAERILIQEIQRAYPNREHVAMWKEREKAKQLDAEEKDEAEGLTVRRRVSRPLLECESIEEYLGEYLGVVYPRRKKLQQEDASPRRKARAYRYNPFL